VADGNVTMSNDDRLDISEIIDFERYPIGELDASGSRVVGRCPAELAEDGACQLDGFIRPVAAQAVLEEAEMLSGKAFRTDATNLDADPPYLVFETFQKGSFATIAGTCDRQPRTERPSLLQQSGLSSVCSGWLTGWSAAKTLGV
jgi:hypothetical protein